MDGIYGMVPRDKMVPEAVKMRDFYDLKPDAPIYMEEFGFYSLERWQREGHIAKGENLAKRFGFDTGGFVPAGRLGWCEAAFYPAFEVKVLEDRGDYELAQDHAGRHVLYFKGRRSGFMPEYVDHPVKDRKTWEEDVKWRMDPETPGRLDGFDEEIIRLKAAAAQGRMIRQSIIGGYMYLRSLMGPVDLLYKFYDDPELIHECMQTWLILADRITGRYQQHITFEDVFFGEDICYNKGPLISPDMIREFLFPYYQQLLINIKRRQLDAARKLHVQLDTDGFSDTVIDLYREGIGMDYLSPFEVASNCDVVRTGREYPDLLIRGGMDKRVLAQGREAIDQMVDAILPVMRRRGGYIPTCDHGVPEEVSFENYMHFRNRLKEFSK